MSIIKKYTKKFVTMLRDGEVFDIEKSFFSFIGGLGPQTRPEEIAEALGISVDEYIQVIKNPKLLKLVFANKIKNTSEKALTVMQDTLIPQALSYITRNDSDDEADTFAQMWAQQLEFMTLLNSLGKFPDFPVDLSTKSGQQIVRDVIRDCADELHEARVNLKNAKAHRQTNVAEFDRNAYVEELVDAMKFLLEALITSNVSIQEFITAFENKTKINTARVLKGY